MQGACGSPGVSGASAPLGRFRPARWLRWQDGDDGIGNVAPVAFQYHSAWQRLGEQELSCSRWAGSESTP